MKNGPQDPAARIAWYSRAYLAQRDRPGAGTRADYKRAYQAAMARQECMLCARPMTLPHTLSEMDTSGRQTGPEILAHQDCWDTLHAAAGFTRESFEPQGVDSRGTILGRTEYRRDKDSGA